MTEVRRRSFLKLFAAPAVLAVPTVAKAAEEPAEEKAEKKGPAVPEATLKELLADKIAQHARYNEYVHNGWGWEGQISYCYKYTTVWKHCFDCRDTPCEQRTRAKARASERWEGVANMLAEEIEQMAAKLGYATEWPGIYPEFEPLNEEGDSTDHA